MRDPNTGRCTRRFAVAAALTMAALVAVGWATGLRAVVHRLVIGIAVGLLPLLVTLVLIAAVFSLARLAARRHPICCGIVAGALSGALVLATLVGVMVLPGELRTLRALVDAKLRLERFGQRTGAFPNPDAAGQLRIEDGDAIHDGFGRPCSYEATARWKLGSWRLVSHGYDGRPSDDDLCLSGRTKQAVSVDDTLDASGLIAAAASDAPALVKVRALRTLRCR